MSEPPEDRGRFLRLKLPIGSKIIVAEHRRLPWGGVAYHDGLSQEVADWCAERGIPLPAVDRLPDDPFSRYVFFNNEDHAFEFKMRWYEPDGR